MLRPATTFPGAASALGEQDRRAPRRGLEIEARLRASSVFVTLDELLTRYKCAQVHDHALGDELVAFINAIEGNKGQLDIAARSFNTLGSSDVMGAANQTNAFSCIKRSRNHLSSWDLRAYGDYSRIARGAQEAVLCRSKWTREWRLVPGTGPTISSELANWRVRQRTLRYDSRGVLPVLSLNRACVEELLDQSGNH